MPSDFYELLEVPPDADGSAIDTAFREKAREYHPDRNDHEQATEQFQVLKKAHEVLSDPDDRAAYDRLGHERYVATRLGGLPGIDVVSSAGGGQRTQGGGTAAAAPNRTARAAQPAGRTNGGASRATTQSASRRRRRRQYYRTTPGGPPGPGRIANTIGLIGASCYGLGMVGFVRSERPAVAALVASVQSSESVLAGLTAEALSLSRLLAFTTVAVSEGSIGLALLVGTVLLALAAILAARRIQDIVAWGVCGVSLGPFVGLGLAWLSSTGLLVLPSQFGNAAVTLLVFFVIAPLGTAGGWLWLVGRGRRL